MLGFFRADYLFSASLLIYLGAAVMSLLFRNRHKACNIIANTLCITAAALGAASSLMLLTSGEGPLIIDIKTSIPFVSLNITMDKLSAFFTLGLSALVMCVALYSIGYVSHYYGKRNVGAFNFLFSLFILSMVLVITAGNAIFFLISWEVMSVVSYFLVVFESEKEENRKAGILYIIMTHIGTAFLMIAFLLMYAYTGSFDFLSSSSMIPSNVRNLLFVLFLAGFGTKAGVIPVHIWLPYAHPAAPGNISALMSGIMIKTALYGILRFVLDFLGAESAWWGYLILAIGVSSAVLGVAHAYVEQNMKRLLAYSTIENIGIIFIGLGAGFVALAQKNTVAGALAITASLFHAFNHTLFKGGLFLGAGSVHYSTHTKNMEEMGGLIKRMPVTALFMLGGALSISALVPFNGFAGEWLTYQSLFAGLGSDQPGISIAFMLSVAALALSGALAAACFIKLFGISFLGLPRSEMAEHAREVPAPMNFGIGVLISLCLVIGLFPMPFIRLADQAVLGLTGFSVFPQLKGGFLIASWQVEVLGNNISPYCIPVLLVSAVLAALLVSRLFGGKNKTRVYETWGCGFKALSPRMQYSATGFSKPLKIVFRILFRPSRKLSLEGKDPYHPSGMRYAVSDEPVFERYLYNPIMRFARAFSRKTKYRVQTGSVHLYLIYIFIVVLALMLYNRLA